MRSSPRVTVLPGINVLLTERLPADNPRYVAWIRIRHFRGGYIALSPRSAVEFRLFPILIQPRRTRLPAVESRV